MTNRLSLTEMAVVELSGWPSAIYLQFTGPSGQEELRMGLPDKETDPRQVALMFRHWATRLERLTVTKPA